MSGMTTEETSWASFAERISAATTLEDLGTVDHELFGRKA